MTGTSLRSFSEAPYVHRLIRSLLLCITLSVFASGTASAGPNAGGTLVVSVSEEIVYTSDADYCGLAEAASCADVDTEAPKDSLVVAHVMAAFPPGSPRLAGVTFGVSYDSQRLSILDSGACSDVELPEPAWPDSGTGVALSFSPARTEPFVELYWFAIQADSIDALFELIPHPTEGAFFADDSDPAELDPVEHLGSLGFGIPGNASCPGLGACCLADGTCRLDRQPECEEAGGMFQGEGSVCDPNPCPPPVGACCFVEAECQILEEADCIDAEGAYQGHGTACEPDPCPQAVCTVEPSSIDFGFVEVGAFVDTVFVIRNDGGAILEGEIVESCAEFAILEDPFFSLLPGEFREFTLRFSPAAEGSVQCDLDLGLDCGLLPVSGTAIRPETCGIETPDPDAPLTLQFGQVGTGRTRDLSFTITNLGEGTLSGVVSETCPEFAIIGPSAYSLGPGETATVTVRFSPNVEGLFECVIDTGADCDAVTAIGEGVPPPVCQVDPVDLDFGTVAIGQSADRIFRITNTGVGDLEGTVLEGCPQFSIVGSGAYHLGAGEFQDVRVRFQPNTTGPASCELTVGPGCAEVVAHGVGDQPPQCVITPDELDFGVVSIGTYKDLKFQIRNEGGGVVSGTVTESCPAFAIVGPAGYQLAAGDSMEFTVRFIPPSRGVFDCVLDSNCGDVIVTGEGDDAPACLFNPPALVFGDAPVGESRDRTITLTNSGGQVLSGTLSSGCPDFEVLGDADYELRRGEQKQFTVRFSPVSVGPKVCVLDSGNPFCSGPQATGNGTPGAVCSVSVDSLDFGELLVGETAELSFEIENQGGGTLTGSVQVECGDFTLLGDPDYSLGPGASKQFTVQFHPASAGPAFCRLATGALCDSLTLRGSAIPSPVCEVEPSELDFGPVDVDGSETLEFEVTNAGGGRLQGVVSASCDDFTIERSGGGDLAYDLGAGESARFEVRFAPASEGSAECSIAVGDGCPPVVATGVGVLNPRCAVEPDTLLFGLVPIGESAETILLVRNAGGGVLSGTVASGCPQITIGNGVYELGAGEEAEVTVRFTPSDLGPLECAITTGASCDPVIAMGEGDLAPECELSENVIDLGTTTVSDSLVTTVTVTNVGGGVLSGTVRSDCPEFVVRGDGEYALERDESAAITIVFHPSSTGPAECVIDAGENCHSILLQAFAEPDPECLVSHEFLDFGEVPVGGVADRTFTIRNVGGGTLRGVVRPPCPEFEVMGDSLYALGREETKEFRIRFRPPSTGSYGCLIDAGGSCQGVAVVGVARSANGACCFPDFSCFIGSGPDCAVAGGTYFGDGTTCDPSPCAPGACCVDGLCSIETESDCVSAGGEWTEGADCADIGCEPVGACCIQGECSVTTEASCLDAGGSWSEGEDCATTACPSVGACCYPDGSCAVITQTECDLSGGTYQGDGETCEAAACEILGACCFSDGSCLQLSESDCLDLEGRSWEANTLCADADCAPVGACCTREGDCLILSEANCGDGAYQGDETSCSPQTCAPPGACCASDGSCTIVEEAACDGVFVGGVCTPDLCAEKVDEVTIVPAGTSASFRVRTTSSAVQDLQGWYRVGGTLDYRQIPAFTREGDLWTGEFDRDDYSVRGLEYYLTYFDAGMERLVSYGSAEDPYRVAVDGEATAPPLTPYRYRMVSAPVVVDPAAAFERVRARFGNPGVSSWRMGWWDPAQGLYVTIDPAHPRAFESGRAYWLAFAASQESWTLPGSSKLPEQGTALFALSLAPGWNMVGNPAAYAVSVAPERLSIDDRGTVSRFDEARAAGLVSDLYVYDPSLPLQEPFYPYVIRPSSLAAWSGCWVENRADHEITLLIPAVEAALLDGFFARSGSGDDESATASRGGSDPLAELAWSFPIRARSLESSETPEQATVVLALDPAARDSEDRFDVQSPPAAPGSQVRMSLEGAAGPLLLDARNADSEPVWILDVECPVESELSWDAPVRVDAPDWTLCLRVGNGVEWDLRTLRSMPLGPGRHRIEIRSRGIPPRAVDGLRLTVEPNPFREATAFRFALPEPERVALAVFDASGQRVWEASERELGAGEHALIWTGRDLHGSAVPAGTYFVRLRAGDADRTERFVLLR